MYAKSIGNNEAYTKFIKRAQYYKNILDYKTGFVRPRKNGGWISPFDPREVNNHFTEANSWQYSFYFPQDINGYISMMGGKKKLETKLDALFNENSKTTGRDQSDITGLIGQYAHGNEPSHHIVYLYAYSDTPKVGQKYIRTIINNFHDNTPNGMIGNDDCGQMSAWYIMSSLGFYPVNPANSEFVLGVPQFKKATLHLKNKKTFTINAFNFSSKNNYQENPKLNNSVLTRLFIKYTEIMSGGNLNFQMTNK
jgi:predicted alpha-1,2-mannosidase